MLTTTWDTTLDQIEQGLTALESVISKARARQVGLLRDADEMQVRSVDGARTLADWVSGRLDLHPITARALSAVARSESRVLSDELSHGHVSFDQTVATLWLVKAGADEATVARSLGVAVNNVTALTARHAQMTVQDERDVFASRSFCAQPDLASTSWRLRGLLPAVDGERVFVALHATADRIFPARSPGRSTLRQRRADALVAWAIDAVAPVAANEAARPSSPRGLGTVLIDAGLAARTRGHAGASTRSGVKVGPNTLHEILCEGTISVAQECDDTVHKIGEAGSAMPPATRDKVWDRDVGCTIDGCTSDYRRQPHHMIEQKHGGDHRLSNLTLLCWFHHHIMIHQQGFTLDPASPPGGRRLLRPVHDKRTSDRDPPLPSP